MITELIHHKGNIMAHYKVKSTINYGSKLFKTGEIIELDENETKHFIHLLDPVAILISNDSQKKNESPVLLVTKLPIDEETPLTQDKTDKTMDSVNNPKTKKPS
jgi:hypothetical protein